jgi:hypothetical protein
MTTDRHNRFTAIFFIIVGLVGTLPALYPIMFAFEAMSEPHPLSILGGLGTLAGFGFGYALFFGYVRYLRGRVTKPVRLWTATMAYNLVLTGLAFVTAAVAKEGIVFVAWPLFLSILAASAVGRERELQERHGRRDLSRVLWT